MNIYKKLEKQAKEKLQIIQKANDDLNEISFKIDRLSKNDVLPIGTRVRLKEDWAGKIVGWGWSSSVHFMNPSNKATVYDICLYENKLSYDLIFDEESVFVQGEKIIISEDQKHCFNFEPKHIEVIK